MNGRLSDNFGDLGGRIWLNAAHQGALPLTALEALHKAIRWKLQPHHLTSSRFQVVPEQMRATLGRLLDVPAEQIALANSASYGLHVIAHAFPWTDGDEVLLVDNDFPSNLLPWQLLKYQGVTIRWITPRSGAPNADEVADAIGPRTRLFCTSWVFSFTGYTIDLATIGEVCRDRRVAFIVNASQGLGARPLAPAGLPIDALVSVGFKWLCGPYGTGLLWMHPRFRSRLRPVKAYWLTMMSEADLGRSDVAPKPRDDLAAQTYDVFEPANFFNTLPWHAAVEHLLDIGMNKIAAHDQMLVDRLIDRLDSRRFRLLSPAVGCARSTLVYISHIDASRNDEVRTALESSKIHIASRAGTLRIAPHLYNTVEEVDRLVEILHAT